MDQNCGLIPFLLFYIYFQFSGFFLLFLKVEQILLLLFSLGVRLMVIDGSNLCGLSHFSISLFFFTLLNLNQNFPLIRYYFWTCLQKGKKKKNPSREQDQIAMHDLYDLQASNSFCYTTRLYEGKRKSKHNIFHYFESFPSKICKLTKVHLSNCYMSLITFGQHRFVLFVELSDSPSVTATLNIGSKHQISLDFFFQQLRTR